MSVSRIHDLVRTGRATPEQGAMLLELRRQIREAAARRKRQKPLAIILTVLAILLITRAVARADAADSTSAEHFYVEGQDAYDHGDYTTAIAKWQTSFQLSGEHSLLFNIAQAHRLAGDCVDALATYRRFLATGPSDQRQLAEDLARELDGQCGVHPQLPQPPLLPQLPPPPIPEIKKSLAPVLNLAFRRNDPQDPPGHALRIAGVATSVAGLALIVTGLYLSHHGSAIGDDVTAACRAGCDWTAWRAQDADGRRDVAIGRVLGVVGGVGAVAGVVLYYVGRRESFDVAPVGHDGAVVTWSVPW